MKIKCVNNDKAETHLTIDQEYVVLDQTVLEQDSYLSDQNIFKYYYLIKDNNGYTILYDKDRFVVVEDDKIK
jgi:hypothetical protein